MQTAGNANKEFNFLIQKPPLRRFFSADTRKIALVNNELLCYNKNIDQIGSGLHMFIESEKIR